MINIKITPFFIYVFILSLFSFWLWNQPIFYRLKSTIGTLIIQSYDLNRLSGDEKKVNVYYLPNDQKLLVSSVIGFSQSPIGYIYYTHHFSIRYNDGIIKNYLSKGLSPPIAFIFPRYFIDKHEAKNYPDVENSSCLTVGSKKLFENSEEPIQEYLRLALKDIESKPPYEYPWISGVLTLMLYSLLLVLPIYAFKIIEPFFERIKWFKVFGNSMFIIIIFVSLTTNMALFLIFFISLIYTLLLFILTNYILCLGLIIKHKISWLESMQKVRTAGMEKSLFWARNIAIILSVYLLLSIIYIYHHGHFDNYAIRLKEQEINKTLFKPLNNNPRIF